MTVIDTNVFVHARDKDREYGIKCLLFLINFYQGQEQWALDFAGEMQQEYRDNKLEEDWFYQNFYSELCRQNRITYADSKINQKQKEKLIQLGFHEMEDHVFVGTALHADKKIVTDDSDYGVHGEADKQDVYEYMKDELGLLVMNSEQAVEYYKP